MKFNKKKKIIFSSSSRRLFSPPRSLLLPQYYIFSSFLTLSGRYHPHRWLRNSSDPGTIPSTHMVKKCVGSRTISSTHMVKEKWGSTRNHPHGEVLVCRPQKKNRKSRFWNNWRFFFFLQLA